MVLLTLTLPFKIFQALKVMFGFQQLTQVPGKALRRRPESIACFDLFFSASSYLKSF